MAKYAEASAKVRALMDELTPLVQPLSIDEAVLDLSGTTTLHNAAPAVTLNRFARRVERELGITVSIGLAHNRMLAKLAASAASRAASRCWGVRRRRSWRRSRLACCRGWARPRSSGSPHSALPGLGSSLRWMTAMPAGFWAQEGPGWAALARGEDTRPVRPERGHKSISAETTFAADFSRLADLEPPLWLLCEKLGRRLRGADLAAAGVVLKLKTAKFVGRTRNQRLANPTQLPETLFEAAREMLRREADGTAFRLIGIGAAPLVPAAQADRGDLADTVAIRRQARQDAIDRLRARFGASAVQRGRGLPK